MFSCIVLLITNLHALLCIGNPRSYCCNNCYFMFYPLTIADQPVLKNIPNAVLFDLRKLCTKPEYLDAAIDKRTAGSGKSC